MKRMILIGSLCIFLGMTSSCKKSSKAEIPGEANLQGESMTVYSAGGNLYTEKYVLYHAEDGLLRIFDPATKTDIVYCFDPGCEHLQEIRNEKGEVIREGCIAYKISLDSVLLRGNEMFFLQSDGQVIHADRQGEKRKVIAVIPLYKLTTRQVFYTDDVMFVQYANSLEVEEITDEETGKTQWFYTGEKKEKQECGICRINLTDGTERDIFTKEGYNAHIAKLDIRDGHLYFEYYYLDIPYVGPNLETYGPSGAIPEGLTVENYWEEMAKHRWMDIYDYDIETGELNTIISHQREENVIFCKDFFAMAESDGVTGLYRYDGERFHQLSFRIGNGVRSDSGLVCCDEKVPDEYMLIEGDTGNILKRVKIPNEKFFAYAFLGECCYGLMDMDERGRMRLGYIPAEDYWKGNLTNAIAF